MSFFKKKNPNEWTVINNTRIEKSRILDEKIKNARKKTENAIRRLQERAKDRDKQKASKEEQEALLEKQRSIEKYRLNQHTSLLKLKLAKNSSIKEKISLIHTHNKRLKCLLNNILPSEETDLRIIKKINDYSISRLILYRKKISYQLLNGRIIITNISENNTISELIKFTNVQGDLNNTDNTMYIFYIISTPENSEQTNEDLNLQYPEILRLINTGVNLYKILKEQNILEINHLFASDLTKSRLFLSLIVFGINKAISAESLLSKGYNLLLKKIIVKKIENLPIIILPCSHEIIDRTGLKCDGAIEKDSTRIAKLLLSCIIKKTGKYLPRLEYKNSKITNTATVTKIINITQNKSSFEWIQEGNNTLTLSINNKSIILEFQKTPSEKSVYTFNIDWTKYTDFYKGIRGSSGSGRKKCRETNMLKYAIEIMNPL